MSMDIKTKNLKSVGVSMDLIQNYRPYGIAVTDLSAQLWCEKQLEFVLEFGRKKTKEMKRGKERHRDLHEEVAELITVEPISLEDRIALKLHNCLTGILRLNIEGMTRELFMWGNVNSLFVVGQIDELVLNNNKLKILDTKTRRSDRMPSEAQKRTTRFQIRSYSHLLNSVIRGDFTTEQLLKAYKFNNNSKITEEFQNQISEIGDKIEPNLLKLANKVFSLIRELPEVDSNFEVRYEQQETKKLIGIDKFQFDVAEFMRNCNFVEEFWLGKRAAVPVSERNNWKCNYCEFRDRCKRGSVSLTDFTDSHVLKVRKKL